MNFTIKRKAAGRADKNYPLVPPLQRENKIFKNRIIFFLCNDTIALLTHALAYYSEYIPIIASAISFEYHSQLFLSKIPKSSLPLL